MTANKSAPRDKRLDGDKTASFDTSMAFENLKSENTDAELEANADNHGADKANTPESSRFWVHAERLTRILASLGVAAAAIITALQYVGANDGVRSERSFEIVKLWQEEELDQDFTAVQVFVEERVNTVGSGLQRLKGAARKHAMNNLGNTWLVQNRASPTPVEIEPHLDRLTLFFSQIEICIEARLCDSDVLQRYFFSEVDSFWSYFSAYAELRRDAGYPQYGVSVDKLVQRFARDAE